MSTQVNTVAVASVGVGLVFIYGGLKGSSITRTFQELIQGRQPTGSQDNPITVPAAGTDTAAPSSDAQGGTAAANQAIGRQLAAAYGWGSGPEWDALVQLWNHESGWNNRAVNPSSGATGIPQALPASKLPKAGQAPTFAAGPQISWGLSYIKSRYGSPSRAWAAWQSRSPHWY